MVFKVGHGVLKKKWNLKCQLCDGAFIGYGGTKYCSFECKDESKKLKTKIYKKKNKDKINKQMYKRRLDPEYRKKQEFWNSKWRLNNREKVLEMRVRSENKRRALLNAGGNYTEQEWEDMKLRFDFKCAVCFLPKRLTVDHIVPISRGGSNEISNIQPLCRNCNSRKSNKLEANK